MKKLILCLVILFAVTLNSCEEPTPITEENTIDLLSKDTGKDEVTDDDV